MSWISLPHPITSLEELEFIKDRTLPYSEHMALEQPAWVSILVLPRRCLCELGPLTSLSVPPFFSSKR